MSTSPHHPTPLRPGLVVAVLAFAGMGASFMQTILIPIQGSLPGLLNASREDTAWVITATLLASAVCVPVSGRLGDMYGKRRVALILLTLLTAGSVIAALSPGVVPLIVGRALQGVGMGVIPLGIAILRDVLPPDRLGSAVALVSATLGVGGAVGLPLSAVITENLDWHVLFWVAAAIGAVAIVLYATLVPADTEPVGGRFDLVGAVGLAIGLVAVLLAVSKGGEWGWSEPLTLSFLLGGLGVLVVWGVWEIRSAQPLVDLRVSARGTVLMTNLASIAMGFALFASSIVFPQLLEQPVSAGGLGLDLLTASLLLMPSGLAMLAVSPLAGRVQRRVGPKPLLVTGALIIAATYLAAVLLEPSVGLILVVNTVIGIGIGLGYAAMPSLIMSAVPVSETGAANGLNTLMRSLGTSVAAALVAAVLAESSGRSTPSTEGFASALLLGLIAAVACAVLAAFIPRPRPQAVDSEPAAVPLGAEAARAG